MLIQLTMYAYAEHKVCLFRTLHMLIQEHEVTVIFSMNTNLTLI